MSLLYVQWKPPDDEQRNCPKHVELHSKINLRNLVHLVGFIIGILIRSFKNKLKFSIAETKRESLQVWEETRCFSRIWKLASCHDSAETWLRPLKFSSEFSRVKLSVTRRNARRSQVMFTVKIRYSNVSTWNISLGQEAPNEKREVSRLWPIGSDALRAWIWSRSAHRCLCKVVSVMEVKHRAFSAPALCPAFAWGHFVLFQTVLRHTFSINTSAAFFGIPRRNEGKQ